MEISMIQCFMYLINKYITQRFLYTDFYIYLGFKQVRINNKFQFIPLFSLICFNTRSIPLTWQNFSNDFSRYLKWDILYTCFSFHFSYNLRITFSVYNARNNNLHKHQQFINKIFVYTSIQIFVRRLHEPRRKRTSRHSWLGVGKRRANVHGFLCSLSQPRKLASKRKIHRHRCRRSIFQSGITIPRKK